MGGDGRGRWSDRERYWRGVISRYRRAGDTIRVFCEREGISEWAFYRWRKRFREDRPVGKAEEGHGSKTFVPVKVVERRSRKDEANGRGSGVELVLGGGRSIRVMRDFDEKTFRRVLAAMVEAGC